ncbi:MAG: RNA 2',3'-cyclic phosphodiesterase [Patescibacteria group bacterium]
MKRRIFIAINLPEKIKKRLKEYREQHNGLPVRWTKMSSLHLTLVFIGYVDNEQMLEACKITRKVAEGVEPFFINFKRIIFGPVGKEPRMIWLEGQISEELSQLKSRLEKALLAGDTGFRKPETRAFSPHLTLARIKADEWRQLSTSDVNSVEQKFEAQVEVNSIEVMESDLKFDGAEYATLEECPLLG